MTEPTSGADGQSPTDADPRVNLSWALSQMSGLLLSRQTIQTALELVTTLARIVTDGTLGAGVTIVDEHGTRSLAASNQAVHDIDAVQYQLDEGPCLTSWRTGELVRIDDTTTDGRWRRWNQAASRLGVRSVLSVPLIADGEPLGAMKVYCERINNYGAKDEQVMLLLAGQAAILLANTQNLQQAKTLSRQLTAALGSRDTIAQATGALLARGAASGPAAFETLTTAAGQSGHTVEEVARALLTAVTAENSHAAGS